MLKRTLLTLVLALVAAPAAHAAVLETPVSFSVRNSDDTALKCATNGAAYTIRGHLVGQPADIDRASGVTLYVHGLGFNESFWRYRKVPKYDLVGALATGGHVSVVIDRLGYGKSSKPPGTMSCMGGQATIVHQIVAKLRSGDYKGKRSPGFGRVGVIGHSAGGTIAALENETFDDTDALGLVASADQGLSQLGQRFSDESTKACNGDRSYPVPKRGYAAFGQTMADAEDGFFATTPDPIFARLYPTLTVNPCGDLASYMNANQLNRLDASRVKDPVLTIQADRDALFPPPAVVPDEADLFTGSAKVTRQTLPSSAHAITFEADYLTLRTDIEQFLVENGL